MRKLTVLFLLSLSVCMFSCGGGAKDKSNNGEEQSNISIMFSAEDGLITAELPEGWQIDGSGPDYFKLYSYIMDNTGDIHKDIIDPYAEILDEVKQVKVDGLPALTKKEKFQQNKAMISRTWLVYNGIDIICVVVQSDMTKWKDEVADNIISLIKINKREENPILPGTVEKGKYIRPDSFPEQVAESFNEHYSQKSTMLTLENIQKSTNIYLALKEIKKENIDFSDEASKFVLDSVSKANSIEDSKTFLYTVKTTIAAIDIIKSFTKLKDIAVDSEDYKMSFNFVKSMVIQTETSKEDLIFVYNNWDACKELVIHFN